jgi:hypothetical protein
MKLNIYITIFLLMLSVTTTKVLAQGCVAVRQMGGINPLSSNGYTLPKGHFQIGTSYRYFHSFRHFVGTDEKAFRQNTQGGFRNGDTTLQQKGNAVNIYSHAIDLNISYGITDRLQLNISIPYVNNERSQVLALQTGNKVIIDGKSTDQVIVGKRYSLHSAGLGDIRIGTNYWVFDPKSTTKGNLLVGAGIKLNSGRHNTKDVVPQKDGTKKLSINDQAIQPGDGGIGFSLELQGFRQLYKGIYGFANGYYLFNPKQSNGTSKSSPDLTVKDANNKTTTLKGYNMYACPDQYFVRAGFMTSVLKDKNLTLSLAGRWEGIPAFDALGGEKAYRRPGYVVAIEPGVSYRAGKHSFSLFVPYNFIKNRIQSANDIASQNIQNAVISDASKKVHVQGDAAFADYSISFNYNYRLGKLF